METKNEIEKENKKEHKYKNIFEIYFSDSDIDIFQILQQPNEQLKVFIKDNIVPMVSDYPPVLRKELEKHKLIKKQTYKEIMKGFKQPSRTPDEQRIFELEKLKKMNPKIVAPKITTI